MKKKTLPSDFELVEPAEYFHFEAPTAEQQSLIIKKLDPCDIVSDHPGGFRQFFYEQALAGRIKAVHRDPYPIPSLRVLGRTHPKLREPIIEGVMRRGETMNIIAPPKKGKSWLSGNLVMSIATGSDWFQKFKVRRGRSIIFDNELHPETIFYRYKLLGESLGVPQNVWEDMIHIVPLRGKGVNILDLERYFETIRPGDYTLCILDSFYRFMPHGFNENDNASMTQLYNTIDMYAERYNVSFALIHHTSKGVQANKSVTDVGSGAGAQSRACDVHFILRDHDQDNVTIVDMAVRSFEPVDNFCVRFKFPIFELAPSYNPDDLKGKDGARGGRPSREKEQADNMLAEKLLDAIREPMTFAGIQRLAETLSFKISQSGLKRLVADWKSQNRLIISEVGSGNTAGKWVNPNAGKNIPTSQEINQTSQNEQITEDGLDGFVEIPTEESEQSEPS